VTVNGKTYLVMNMSMAQSIGSATNVFQTPRDITVNNHFGPTIPLEPLSWVKAVAECTIESMAFFDETMRLIHYNNKFGTLNGASHRDLADLHSLFTFYGRFYSNAYFCHNIVRQVFLWGQPRSFIMHNHSGWACHCRAYPVIEKMQLRGVVLLANRNERGPELPIGESDCE